ncbi:unnamed protein product [Ectocarpus sp. 12 AP-2014]
MEQAQGMGMPSGPGAGETAAAAAAAGAGAVVTPTRPIGGVESGGRGGSAKAGLGPPVPPSVGGSTGSCGLGQAAGGGAWLRPGTTAKSGGNVDGVLVTPPRLPRPLADGMIVEAATEAARWLAVDDRTWHQARRTGFGLNLPGKKFMDECIADCPNEKNLNRRKLTPEQWRESKIKSIKASIAADPSLATSRHVNKSAFPMDGWTPLHAAAAKGNVEFVKVLLEVPGVSAWAVDLQGRTALALAAAEGHLDLCLLLKARMEMESADTIVGTNAPVDLSGRTPLAWSVKAARQKRNKEVEEHLYAAGDASVCPATPAVLRSGGGRTGTKGAGGGGAGGTARTGAGRGAAESIGDGLPCGYSDAPGWRIEMEDAICRHNPIPVNDPESREAPPADPTSMFGIFDGHGGDFTSTFCARELIECLRGTSGWKSGDRALAKLCPAVMEAFVNVDELLAKQPRMVVTETKNPSDGKRFEARDGSGSTALVSLVTPAHVIVANAGDSRAILIMVPPDHNNSSSGKGKKSKGSNSSDSTKIATSGGGGGGGGSSGSSSRVGVEDKRGAAETMAEALGLKLGGERNSGVEEEKGEATTGGRLAAEGEGGGLNDSVRLEDQEEDDDEGCEFDGADKIRELLESMMLGGEAKEGGGGGGGGGGDGARRDRDDGGGGAGGVMVTAMSRDHTAADEAERERVTAAGGKAFEVPYTEQDGTTCMVVRTAYDDKVEGQSVVPTRGFGDLYYKQRKDDDGNLLPPAQQVVTSCPEIMVHERGSSGKEELLLLACDGVWDVFDDQDAGEFLVKTLDVPVGQVTGEQLALACDALVNECLRRGSTDNITAMAVSLGSGPPPRPSSAGGRVLFSDGQ